MPYADEDLLPISALQHLVFCERQCALIHVEQLWDENQLTAEGRLLHERVDEGYRAYKKGLRQFSGVYVRSLALGIYGRLDVAELTLEAESPDNCQFLGLSGHWTLAPVEFKRGKPKSHNADRIQLCAQALCLEEMTESEVRRGAIFYGKTRRREEVELNAVLRRQTQYFIERHRHIVESGEVPPPIYKRHCRSCSLNQICQPQATRTKEYLEELFS